ncbi:hypothetical protein [Ruegeria sp. SCP11]|uniref:hypothetical protein n=1 Tax=Ruegeria sp. SCP11 TaxID=3141378 RepID=UPI003335A4D6
MLKSRLVTSICIFMALSFVAACDDGASEAKSVTKVKYSGNFNTISGKLSDGSEFEGVAWWVSGAYKGKFCLQTAEAVCSGKFSARASRVIAGQFECSDMATGSYRTERIEKGAHLHPIKATGILSDGRTSVAEFAPLQEGSGETICYQ